MENIVKVCDRVIEKREETRHESYLISLIISILGQKPKNATFIYTLIQFSPTINLIIFS